MSSTPSLIMKLGFNLVSMVIFSLAFPSAVISRSLPSGETISNGQTEGILEKFPDSNAESEERDNQESDKKYLNNRAIISKDLEDNEESDKVWLSRVKRDSDDEDAKENKKAVASKDQLIHPKCLQCYIKRCGCQDGLPSTRVKSQKKMEKCKHCCMISECKNLPVHKKKHRGKGVRRKGLGQKGVKKIVRDFMTKIKNKKSKRRKRRHGRHAFLQLAGSLAQIGKGRHVTGQKQKRTSGSVIHKNGIVKINDTRLHHGWHQTTSNGIKSSPEHFYDNIKIRKSGMYLVYAQVVFRFDDERHGGFILVKETPGKNVMTLSECQGTMSDLTKSPIYQTSCFTMTVAFLEKNSKVRIECKLVEKVSRCPPIVMQPEKTFFGVVRIAGDVIRQTGSITKDNENIPNDEA